MLKVEDYARIRRAHRDGMSIREIARTFRHSRRKIREVLQNPEPRGYTRSKAHPTVKLTLAFQQRVEAILQEDESAPRKQRHTAMAIFGRLAQEGYEGGYDQVRRYVARKRRRDRETFIPLSHDPGQRAEADFGHIYVDFPDGRRQVAVLIITWAYSNLAFAIALPSEKVEAILYGSVEAFRWFGCVPKELWWDNPKTVATSILRGRERKLNDHYLALASHYNFEPLCCLPARGNEKPHVENRVKFLQRRWATPVPRVKDLAELNEHLRRCYQADLERTITGRNESIGQRFTQEQKLAIPLPQRHFDPALSEERNVDKYQSVAYDKNRYSVPRHCAFHVVTVKADVHRLRIVFQGHVIATHERSYGKGIQVLDPLHYLTTLSRKPACLDHSDVYRNWTLPREFGDLREYLEARHGRLPGARQYIRVLQMLSEHSMDRVQAAIQTCRREGVITAERVIHRCQLLRLRDGQSPSGERTGTSSGQDARIASVPTVQVPMPDLKQFDVLLNQGGEENESDRPTTFTESEPQAASATDDVGRILEVGPRSSREQSELSRLSLASDGTGTGDTSLQCLADSYQTSKFPGIQGLGHV